ncbi:hypothetical protein NAEX_08962 [Nannocystis exedens]|nr:hypothetical protein NAEX_08962 [Nannocystis exedens]
MALALTAASLVGLVALHREGLRRVLLRAVDPRPLLFRIAFGCCLLVSLLEIAPLAPYLFSDEGIVPRAAVPELMGPGRWSASATACASPRARATPGRWPSS